jgi:RNA polymerase sigma-70 factor (ECF subfamily)
VNLWTRSRHVTLEPPPVSTPSDLDAKQAFAAYVLPEVETLYRVALSLTRHHADAEDLVQDTLVRAYRSIDRFDGRHPRAWLFTIVRNTHINRQRRRRPELLHDPDATLARLEATEPGGGNVEDHVMDRTFDAVVESSLQSLSPKYRQVVELVDIDGLTYEDAAETLGVPVGTVMSRLHRARRHMRDQLAEAGIAPRRTR